MTQQNSRAIARVGVRAAALASSIVVPLLAAPAFADTPTAWSKTPDVPAWQWLTVLVLIPVGLAVVISLLVLLPGMLKRQPASAGTWMGGPAKGVEQPARDKAEGTGGAGAQW